MNDIEVLENCNHNDETIDYSHMVQMVSNVYEFFNENMT